MNRIEGGGDLLAELKSALQKIKKQNSFVGGELPHLQRNGKNGDADDNTISDPNKSQQCDVTNGYNEHENETIHNVDEITLLESLNKGKVRERATSFRDGGGEKPTEDKEQARIQFADYRAQFEKSSVQNRERRNSSVREIWKEAEKFKHHPQMRYRTRKKVERWGGKETVESASAYKPHVSRNGKDQDLDSRYRNGYETVESSCSEPSYLKNGLSSYTRTITQIQEPAPDYNDSDDVDNVFSIPNNKADFSPANPKNGDMQDANSAFIVNNEIHQNGKSHISELKSRIESHNLHRMKELNSVNSNHEKLNGSHSPDDSQVFCTRLRPPKSQKDDLYRELNCVLKQRKLKSSPLIDVEHKKIGKSFVYFGGGSQRSDSPCLSINRQLLFESGRSSPLSPCTDREDFADKEQSFSKFDNLTENQDIRSSKSERRNKKKDIDAIDTTLGQELLENKDSTKLTRFSDQETVLKSSRQSSYNSNCSKPVTFAEDVLRDSNTSLKSDKSDMYKSIHNLSIVGLDNTDNGEEKGNVHNYMKTRIIKSKAASMEHLIDNGTFDKNVDHFKYHSSDSEDILEKGKAELHKSVRRCADFEKRLKVIGEKLKGGVPCPVGSQKPAEPKQFKAKKTKRPAPPPPNAEKLLPAQSVPFLPSERSKEPYQDYSGDEGTVQHERDLSIASGDYEDSIKPFSDVHNHNVIGAVDMERSGSYTSFQDTTSASLSLMAAGAENNHESLASNEQGTRPVDNNGDSIHSNDSNCHLEKCVDSGQVNKISNDSSGHSFNDYNIPDANVKTSKEHNYRISPKQSTSQGDSNMFDETSQCDYRYKPDFSETCRTDHNKNTISSFHHPEQHQDDVDGDVPQYQRPLYIETGTTDSTYPDYPHSHSPHPGHLISSLVEQVREQVDSLDSGEIMSFPMDQQDRALTDEVKMQPLPSSPVESVALEPHLAETTQYNGYSIIDPPPDYHRSVSQTPKQPLYNHQLSNISESSVKTEAMSQGKRHRGLYSDMSLTTVTSCDNSTTTCTTDDYYPNMNKISTDPNFTLVRKGNRLSYREDHATGFNCVPTKDKFKKHQRTRTDPDVLDTYCNDKVKNESKYKNHRSKSAESHAQFYLPETQNSKVHRKSKVDQEVFFEPVNPPKPHRSKSVESLQIPFPLDAVALKQLDQPNAYYSEDDSQDQIENDNDHMATYPLQRSHKLRRKASQASKHDQDVIARLMITHAGDRIPPDGAECHCSPNNNCHNRVVTVPQPTSFHTQSNRVGRQLLRKSDMAQFMQQSHHTLMRQEAIRIAKNGGRIHMYKSNSADNAHHSSFGKRYGSDSSSCGKKNGSVERRRYQRNNSLDKDQKQLLYHTWSSNVARKVSRHKSSFTRRHWTSVLGNVHNDKQTDDSDSSFGGKTPNTRRHKFSSPNISGVSSSARIYRKSPHGSTPTKSPATKAKAVPLVNQSEPSGMCTPRCSLHKRNESIQSVCTFVMDCHEDELGGEDGDTESLYNTMDVEQSLLYYIQGKDARNRPQDLDPRSVAAITQPDHCRGLFQRLACCFLCRSHMSTISSQFQQKSGHPRCPVTQTIKDTSSAMAFGDGLYKGLEDVPAQFTVDAKGYRGDLQVEVEGPNSMAKCRKEPNQHGQYIITYTPVEVGVYTVHIRWNGRDIDGSPFHPKVVDPRKLRVSGGWESLVDASNRMSLMVGETKRIEFDTSQAGPGVVTAEVRGPDGLINSHVEHLGAGAQILTFVPRVEGEHYINLYWSEALIPRSPIIGVARGGGGGATSTLLKAGAATHEKVVLTGRGLKEAGVRQEAEFVIDGTEAGPGSPEVTLTGVKEDIDVRITPLGGAKYRATYIPQLHGAYLLNIMWADRQVRGSPFKVNVIAHSDATKVVCSGEGLKVGILGREIKSIIDTRRAGPGELTAHCMGPNKVAFCELFDHRDGTFGLSVRPQEPGRHVLQVKYGGEHVPGSPFVLRVSGAPDASKVRVSGPGIEHGILAMYQSRFICETRGAGAGQLTVRIRGPKGAFRVEMQRESQKDRTILCRYDPTEVGDYIISVKWSGEDVPGSPFHIQIFDTQSELERFLHENPSRRTNQPYFPPRSDHGSEWED